MILLYPQWQGVGEIDAYYAAEEIEKIYLRKKNLKYHKVDISKKVVSKREQHILGYADIIKQTVSTGMTVSLNSPDKIFTIGGGCDVDIVPVEWLNRKYDGDMTVFWFGAHGDMKSPKESENGLFRNMPARMLMEPEYELKKIVTKPILPKNFVQLGGRDLDAKEKKFILVNNIDYLSVEMIMNSINEVLEGKNTKYAYIHFGLDVLDPKEFSSVQTPVKKGMSISTAKKLLSMIKDKYQIVGFGLYEYKKSGQEQDFIEYIFDYAKELF